MTMTAGDVLIVLNGMKSVNLNSMSFIVITDAPDGRSYWPFHKGEIIVVDFSGREPFGEGRKPAKWDVGEAEFYSLDEAKACSRQVLAGTWPRSYG